MSALSDRRGRVVAVGGGHGAAQSLRAALLYAEEVAAVISVADDGGSSGKLREVLGIPAPGDVRRCLTALMPEGSPLAAAFEHRFGEGELEGHAFGNLLLASLARAFGDFAEGVREAARISGARGRVFPATGDPVVLKGLGEGGEVSGQVEIKRNGSVRRVSLVPADAAPPAGAAEALLKADQILLGPGSLYTSVLAVTAVPELREAIARSEAQRVYVANLRDQPPETASFSVSDHVTALLEHGVVIDVVVTDPAGLPLGDLPGGIECRQAALALEGLTAHDPALLAEVLRSLLATRASASRGSLALAAEESDLSEE